MKQQTGVLVLAALLASLVATGTGCWPQDASESASPEEAAPDMMPEAAASLSAAQNALERGDFERALALTDSAARYAPDQPEVYFVRGNIFTQLNRFDEARLAYREVLERDHSYVGAWFKLGNNAFLQGRYEEAASYYQKERERILASTRAEEREPLPAVLLQLGRAHKQLGENDKAQQAYERALAVDSSEAQAYSWLSEIYEEQGESERALQLAQQALELESGNLDYHYQAGKLLNQTGQAGEAVRLLSSVIRERPWHHSAYYNLGQAMIQLGRRETGEHLLARADTLQSLHGEIVQAKTATYKEPENPRRWLTLARTMLQVGRFEEAQQAVGVALQLDPTNLRVQNDMANLALARGDTTEARRRYHDVLKQDSTFADAWLNLGVLRAESGDYEAARHAWEQALRFDENHREARAYLTKLDQMQ